MSDDRNDLCAYQLGSDIGCNFWFALIILDNELNLLAIDAALVIVFLDNQLGCIDSRQAIGSQVARVCAGDTNLYGWRRKYSLCTKEEHKAHYGCKNHFPLLHFEFLLPHIQNMRINNGMKPISAKNIYPKTPCQGVSIKSKAFYF